MSGLIVFLMFVTIVVILCIVLKIRRAVWLKKYAPPRVQFPGRSTWSLLKALMEDPTKLIKECEEKYGSTFYFDFWVVQICVALGASGTKLLSYGKDDELSFFEAVKFTFRVVFGSESLKEGAEEEHKYANKIVSTLAKNKDSFQEIMFNEIIEHFDNLAQSGQPFDWFHEIDELITNINIRCLLGEEARYTYSQQFKDLYDQLEKLGFSKLAVFTPWLPGGPAQQCEKIRESIQDILAPLIEKRRKNNSDTSSPRNRLGDHLNTEIQEKLASGDEWSEVSVVQRMLALFFAARVNTTRTLFWLTMNSYRRPELIDDLRKELDPLLPEVKNNDVPLYDHIGSSDWRDLLKSNYLENVFRESIRPLHSHMALYRLAMKDFEYKNYIIPKGWYVITSGQVYGKPEEDDEERKEESVKNFLQDWEDFKPDRWDHLRNNVEASRWLYIFFGHGNHKCKGEMLAMMTIKSVWSLLVTRYNLKWENQEDSKSYPVGTPELGGLPSPNDKMICSLSRRC